MTEPWESRSILPGTIIEIANDSVKFIVPKTLDEKMKIPAGAPDLYYRLAALLLMRTQLYEECSVLEAAQKTATWWEFCCIDRAYKQIARLWKMMPWVSGEHFFTLLERHECRVREIRDEAQEFFNAFDLPAHARAPGATRQEVTGTIARMVGLTAQHVMSSQKRGSRISLTRAIEDVARLYAPLTREESVAAAGVSVRQIKEHWAKLAPLRHLAMAYALSTLPEEDQCRVPMDYLFLAAEMAQTELPKVK